MATILALVIGFLSPTYPHSSAASNLSLIRVAAVHAAATGPLVSVSGALPPAPAQRRPRTRAPRGAIQAGWIVGVLLCALADLVFRRKTRDVDVPRLWRNAAVFVREAWTHIPGPLGITVVSLGVIDAVTAGQVRGTAEMGLILLAVVGVLAGSIGVFGGGYRLALRDFGVSQPSRWGVKIGRVEARLLGTVVLFGVLFVAAFIVLRFASDMLTGVLRPMRMEQLPGLAWTASAAFDTIHLHYAMMGAALTISGAATATLPPMATVGGGWSLKAALAQTRGAWLPISIASLAPNLAVFAFQRAAGAARAAGLLATGLERQVANLFADLAVPMIEGLLLPFGIGLSVALYRRLSNAQPSENIESVFD